MPQPSLNPSVTFVLTTQWPPALKTSLEFYYLAVRQIERRKANSSQLLLALTHLGIATQPCCANHFKPQERMASFQHFRSAFIGSSAAQCDALPPNDICFPRISGPPVLKLRIPHMKIAIGADHAGLDTKNLIRDDLGRRGHTVTDYGTNSRDSTDYPDYAAQVARDVASGAAERGILVCSTGVGMSIAANKVHGIRAALGWDPREVELTRQHNNANVLTLGASLTPPALCLDLVRIFLETNFDGGRHERRVNKISELETD